MTYSEYRKAWLSEDPDMPEETIESFWAELCDYEERQEAAWQKVTEKYDVYDDFARDKASGKWYPLEAVMTA